MAYKLELPASSRVHLLFHLSYLKKVIGGKVPIQTIFMELDEEGKSSWNLQKSMKQGPRDYKIRLLLSTSSNERIY